MAHSLNIAAKHVLEAFMPTPPHRILAEGKDSRAANPVEVDQDGIDEEESELDENETVDFQPGDILGKAHAFVNQACPPLTALVVVVFLTGAIRRCASLHKPAHSSPSSVKQPTCPSVSLSSGVAHDGHPWTT
jgi:hypothetical protein